MSREKENLYNQGKSKEDVQPKAKFTIDFSKKTELSDNKDLLNKFLVKSFKEVANSGSWESDELKKNAKAKGRKFKAREKSKLDVSELRENSQKIYVIPVDNDNNNNEKPFVLAQSLYLFIDDNGDKYVFAKAKKKKQKQHQEKTSQENDTRPDDVEDIFLFAANDSDDFEIKEGANAGVILKKIMPKQGQQDMEVDLEGLERHKTMMRSHYKAEEGSLISSVSLPAMAHGEKENKYYVAEIKFPGKNFKEHLEKRKKMKKLAISKNDFSVAKKMFEVLDAFHSDSQFIHGDIKLENFIVDIENRNIIRVKLIDMELSEKKNTYSAAFRKKPSDARYCSKTAFEQMSADTNRVCEHRTQEADIYAAGLVLGQILSRQVFQKFSNGELSLQHSPVTDKYKFLQTFLDDKDSFGHQNLFKSKILATQKLLYAMLLETMLAEDPTNRPTAKEVSQILENISRFKKTAKKSYNIDQNILNKLCESVSKTEAEKKTFLLHTDFSPTLQYIENGPFSFGRGSAKKDQTVEIHDKYLTYLNKKKSEVKKKEKNVLQSDFTIAMQGTPSYQGSSSSQPSAGGSVEKEKEKEKEREDSDQNVQRDAAENSNSEKLLADIVNKILNTNWNIIGPFAGETRRVQKPYIKIEGNQLLYSVSPQNGYEQLTDKALEKDLPCHASLILDQYINLVKKEDGITAEQALKNIQNILNNVTANKKGHTSFWRAKTTTTAYTELKGMVDEALTEKAGTGLRKKNK